MPELITDLQTRLLQIAAIAVAIEKQNRCPAQLMIAQWAVESKWGAKPIGQANYFGMKKNSRDPESCTEPTEEVVDGKPIEEELEFADYDSLDASAADYAVLITQGDPYREAWALYLQNGDLDVLASAVAAKYASAPAYGQLVIVIAHQANVARAIAIARAGRAAADPAASQEMPHAG